MSANKNIVLIRSGVSYDNWLAQNFSAHDTYFLVICMINAYYESEQAKLTNNNQTTI